MYVINYNFNLNNIYNKISIQKKYIRFIVYKYNMNMDEILGLFSQRSGLSSSVASMGLSLVSKFLLRNAEPQRASGFMSMLPSSITNMFSNDEKQRFTTTQENVSEDEVIDQISRILQWRR